MSKHTITVKLVSAVFLCVCVSRPPVKGCRDEQNSLAERWNSRQKPEGDEGGDPGHASRDEKTTAGREEEHRRGGDGVWAHTNTFINAHTHTHTRRSCIFLPHTTKTQILRNVFKQNRMCLRHIQCAHSDIAAHVMSRPWVKIGDENKK